MGCVGQNILLEKKNGALKLSRFNLTVLVALQAAKESQSRNYMLLLLIRMA